VKINQIKNTPKFSGLYNNKILLSSLETISNHGASFAAGASFVGALGLRPLAISITPKVNKENKKALSAESIASGAVKLLVALGVSLPIENEIKKISKNPEFLKDISKNEFNFIVQTIKMGSNLISAIPKSILGVALIPVIMDLFSDKKENKKDYSLLDSYSFNGYKKQVSFKGNKFLTSIIESKRMQEFAKNNLKDEKNIARNMSIATDILLTTTGALGVKISKKINEKNKSTLILNKILSSGISIFAGFQIDEIVQKLGKGFVENFKNANLNDSKLPKYLEGLNILRPTLIFALIYYGIIPIITTFVADKINNVKND